MSLHYTTKCDICGKQEHDWPQDMTWSGWVQVNEEHKRLDFCPECWAKVQKLLAMTTPTSEEGK